MALFELQSAGAALLEHSINQALSLDCATKEKLSRMEGKSIAVHCSEPALSIYLFLGPHIRVQSYYDGSTTASLRGTRDELATLAFANDKASALINGKLTLTGDSQLLLELQKILTDLDLDWEAPLALLLGDVAAHHIGRSVRGFLRWGKKTQQSFTRNAADFLQEEARLTPPPLEMEDFYSDISSLTLKLDRQEARLRQLRSKIQRLTNKAAGS